jgi:hypothetical protein
MEESATATIFNAHVRSIASHCGDWKDRATIEVRSIRKGGVTCVRSARCESESGYGPCSTSGFWQFNLSWEMYLHEIIIDCITTSYYTVKGAKPSKTIYPPKSCKEPSLYYVVRRCGLMKPSLEYKEHECCAVGTRIRPHLLRECVVAEGYRANQRQKEIKKM